MAKRLVKKKQLTESEIISEADKYLELDSEVKSVTKKRDAIKATLKEVIDTNGTESPEGHIILDIPVKKDKVLRLKNTCRVTTSLKTDALEVIKSDLPKLKDKLIETIEVVREDRLENMVKDGVIPDEIVDKLYSASENFAFNAPKYISESEED